MKRIKSRNYILFICGIFFFVIVLFAIFIGVFKIVNEIKEKNIYDSIALVSSEIQIKGNGNFVESTPTVSKASIENFNVYFKNIGDSIKYSVKLCNRGKDDLMIDNIISDSIICNNGVRDINCDDIKINGYVDKESDMFTSGQCIDFVVEAECVTNLEQKTFLFIDDYRLDLVKFNNK